MSNQITNLHLKPPFDFALIFEKETTQELIQSVKDSIQQEDFQSQEILDIISQKKVLLIKNENYPKLLEQAEKLKIEKQIQNNEAFSSDSDIYQQKFEEKYSIVTQMEKYKRFIYHNKSRYLQENEKDCDDQHIFKELFTQAEQIIIKYWLLQSVKLKSLNQSCQQQEYFIHYLEQKCNLEDIICLHNKQGLNEFREQKTQKTILQTEQRLQYYFGENVAFYFEFLQYFQKWLIYGPVFVGLITVLLDNYLGENVETSPYDSIFSLFIVIWASLFFSFWQKREQQLRIYNRSFGKNYQDIIKLHQQNYNNQREKFDFIKWKKITYYPKSTRIFRQIGSFLINLPILFITMIVLVCSLNIRGYIDFRHQYIFIYPLHELSLQDHIFYKEGNLSFLPDLIHVIVVAILNIIYQLITKKITKWECHSTQESYNNSIIVKRFIFEFITTFTDLSYLAFIRCNIVDLKKELISIFMIDEFRRIGTETILPLIQKWIIQKKIENYYKKFGQIDSLDQQAISNQQYIKEKQIEINLPEYEPFDDYLEIIINFGYLTLFASALNFSPIIFFGFHQLEIWSDKFKLNKVYKRPMPNKSSGIGSWNSFINITSVICVITNIVLFAFTSDQIKKYLPSLFDGPTKAPSQTMGGIGGKKMLMATPAQGQGRYMILDIFIIEHILFFILWLCRKIIYEKEDWTKIYLKRKDYKKVSNK